MGGAGALLAGLSAIAIPGIGLLVAGPLATALTAAGVGAATGGLVGALVDKGIPDNQAKHYQQSIDAGQVLVSVEAAENVCNEAADILKKHGATEVGHDHT
jgi:uncharacterized membrane protein